MEIKVKDARVDSLRHRRFPFAMIGHCENNEGTSFVDVDFRPGGARGTCLSG